MLMDCASVRKIPTQTCVGSPRVLNSLFMRRNASRNSVPPKESTRSMFAFTFA